MSCLVVLRVVLCCVMLYGLVLSCFVMHCLLLPGLVLSCLVLFDLVLHCHALYLLSCLVLSCVFLSCVLCVPILCLFFLLSGIASMTFSMSGSFGNQGLFTSSGLAPTVSQTGLTTSGPAVRSFMKHVSPPQNAATAHTAFWPQASQHFSGLSTLRVSTSPPGSSCPVCKRHCAPLREVTAGPLGSGCCWIEIALCSILVTSACGAFLLGLLGATMTVQPEFACNGFDSSNARLFNQHWLPHNAASLHLRQHGN